MFQVFLTIRKLKRTRNNATFEKGKDGFRVFELHGTMSVFSRCCFEEKFIGPASLRETGFTRHSCSQVCWLCSYLVSPGTAVHRFGCAVVWFHQAQLFTGLLVVQSFGFTKVLKCQHYYPCSLLIPFRGSEIGKLFSISLAACVNTPPAQRSLCEQHMAVTVSVNCLAEICISNTTIALILVK